MSLPRPTPSQTVGPFFRPALIGGPIGADLVPRGTPGALSVEGVVLDGAGHPVGDALVELWQADPSGQYRSGADTRAPSVPPFSGFGRAATDDEGLFQFVTVKPGPVPHPDGRTQAPHVVMSIFARGLLKRLVTRMYFPDEEAANQSDPILSSLSTEERTTLVAHRTSRGVAVEIRLQGPEQTVFFAL